MAGTYPRRASTGAGTRDVSRVGVEPGPTERVQRWINRQSRRCRCTARTFPGWSSTGRRTSPITALIWDPPDGEERSWTYRELLADVRRVAAGLVERGVGRGDKVLIHADNCPEMLLSWLACATVGAVAVTTNTRSAPSEVAYFAGHTKCTGAITEAEVKADTSPA